MAKKKTDDKLVINQLIVKAPQRKTADVGEWRNAMQTADSGRMKRLYDLFEDLLIDGILGDAVGKRKDAIANAELTFQNSKGEDIPEMTALIDTLEFEELLRLLMDVRFWGRTGIEFGFTTDGNISVFEIPKKHINLLNETILINDTDEVGIPYAGDDNLLILGRKRDYGLFLRTAPFVIWKRGGFGDYAQWLEIFGMPQRVGKYSSYDPESRKLLEQALEQAGSAPYVVIPKESEVETTNNTGSGSSGASYNDFRHACNEEILITVLGQTLTTVQGEKGARSLGEVHKAVEEGKNRSDMRFVQRILNQHVLPVLERRGYPVKGGRFIFPESAAELDVAEIVQLSDILEIPASYLHDKFSIPVPKGGEPIARRAAQPAPEEAGNKTAGHAPSDTEDEEPDNKGASPLDNKKKAKLSDDRNLLERMLDFFAYAPLKKKKVRFVSPSWGKSPKGKGASGAERTNFAAKWLNSTGNIATNLADEVNLGINVDKLFNRALESIYRKHGHEMPVVDKSLFEISNTAYQKAVDKQFRAMGVEFGRKNEAFINEFKYNAAVFAAFKNHRQTNEIAGQLLDENGNLRSFHEFKKTVLGTTIKQDYNRNWLKTEYNMAVRSARSAANFKKYLETAHLYPNLEYLESSAATQRRDHLEWVGTVLPISHPWWDKHMPPSEWGCECSVRNTDKPVTPVPDDATPVSPVFDNNPGKTAEIVNMKEHPYIKGVCENFEGCSYRMSGGKRISLTDSPAPNKPECAICIAALAYYKKVNMEQEVVRRWYKKTLPVVNVGKFIAKRFEVEHVDINRPIIINRNFYEEVMNKYQNDPKYYFRLELLKNAHNLIKESGLTRSEPPKHHADAIRFLVFTYDKDGLKLEFKCKDNPDGVFLYYMRIIE